MVRWLLPLAALLLAPAAARAQCVSSATCVCAFQPVSIAELRVDRLDGPVTHATVLSLRDLGDAGLAAASGFAPGEQVDVPREDSDAPGSTSLAYVAQGGLTRRVAVESDGKVKCPSADPDFRVEKEAAIDAALSLDCEAKLRAQGFRQPECHDTGYGCLCGAGAGPTPVALLLALWAARRRGRRGRSLLALAALSGCGLGSPTCREPEGQQRVFARNSQPRGDTGHLPCPETFSGTATFHGTGQAEIDVDAFGHFACSVSGSGSGDSCFMSLNCGELFLRGTFEPDGAVVNGSAELTSAADAGCQSSYEWSMTR